MNVSHPNVLRLIEVARRLEELRDELIFVGGATVTLLTTRPVTQVREFQSRDEAYTLRNKPELAKESHVEVVVLEGDSLDAIKRTHRRYFYSLEELSI